MKIKSLTPMLTVTAIAEAVAFYCNVLGFKSLASLEAWGCVGRDGFEVMFSLPNSHLPFEMPTMTGSIYFNTDDVNSWWERLKGVCVIEYPIEDFAYGMREFAIRDNSGYLLQFGQRIR